MFFCRHLSGQIVSSACFGKRSVAGNLVFCCFLLRGHEDSGSDSGDATLGPPGAEPLQHIVYHDEGTEAVRLLGLETVNFQSSIWDASVIVMLHACDRARKVVGNFNVPWPVVLKEFFLVLPKDFFPDGDLSLTSRGWSIS